ncbi:restriction endonuclease [Streptomyces sp. NPDC051555]|uniref:restriction endonuclease n=1 Tax=Streptomyces sp. NPDC051555 TaxID=3365657 RepID=UPI0037885431
MRSSRQGGGISGRGSASLVRDVVLAVGLVAICLGGLAVFLRSTGADGAGAFVIPLGTAVLLATGVALAKRGVAPDRHHPRTDLAELPSAPSTADAYVGTDVYGGPEAHAEADAYTGSAPQEVPDIGSGALDHAAVDADGFEHAVAALCARDGCTAVEVVGGAGDLGADVLATTAQGLRVVLQCKHYGDGNRVGSQDLQRFGGTCFAVHEADVAILVTTSSFTAPALEYAALCGIVCVDGEALAAWTESGAAPPWDAVGDDTTAPVPVA